MPSPGLVRGIRAASGPGHPRRRRRAAGLYGAGLLRLDDREAGGVGRHARRGDRADDARARGVRGARHPDDDSVLPLADARARLPSPAGSTRPISIGCSRRGAASRSARSPPQKSSRSRSPRRSTRCSAPARPTPARPRTGGSAWTLPRQEALRGGRWSSRGRDERSEGQRRPRAPSRGVRGASLDSDDIRDRAERPRPHRVDRARRQSRALSRDRRRRGHARRRASAAATFGVSLLFPDAAHDGVTMPVRARPGAPASCSRTSAAAPSPSPSTAAAPAAAPPTRGGGAHGEQKVVAPMPGRVVRVLVAAGDEVERAPAGRRRRGDEDGERAALAEGGTRQGRRRRPRHVGRGRPRAGGHRVSHGRRGLRR